jgi:hypothetical protein
MGGLGVVLSAIGGIASFIGGIIILVAAFKESVGQGFLCLCIPFYVFYFAFAKYESEKKGLVIAVWLGGTVVNIIGALITMAGAASSLPTIPM